MVQKRQVVRGRFPAFFFVLITLGLIFSPAIWANVFKDKAIPKWLHSEHGDLVICQSVSKKADDTAVLNRYLLLTPQTILFNSLQTGTVVGRSGSSDTASMLRDRMRDELPRQFDMTSQPESAYQKLVQLRDLFPFNIAFLVERYLLDASGQVINGEQIAGSLDQKLHPWEPGGKTSCMVCSRFGHLFDPLPGNRHADFSADGILVEARTGINGSRPTSSFGAGQTVHLGRGVTPLFFLADDSASGYQQVYDTLYSTDYSLDFTPARYWPYQDSLRYRQGLGFVGGVGTLGGLSLIGVGAVGMLGPVSLLVGGVATMVGLVASGYFIQDVMNNPRLRSLKMSWSLDTEEGGLKARLESARVTKVNSQVSLTQLGLSGNDTMLRERQREFAHLRSDFDARMNRIRQHVGPLEEKRRDLEGELQRLLGMDVLNDKYLEEELAETALSITQLQKELGDVSPANSTPLLPYPEVDLMPSPDGKNSHERFEHEVRVRVLKANLEDLGKYHQHLQNRKLNKSIDARYYLSTLHKIYQDRIRSVEREIERHKNQISEYESKFEWQYGEKLRYLNRYFEASREIENCERYLESNEREQRVVLKESWLMSLLYSYQQALSKARNETPY